MCLPGPSFPCAISAYRIECLSVLCKQCCLHVSFLHNGCYRPYLRLRCGIRHSPSPFAANMFLSTHLTLARSTIRNVEQCHHEHKYRIRNDNNPKSDARRDQDLTPHKQRRTIRYSLPVPAGGLLSFSLIMLAVLTPPQQINPKGPLFLATTKNVEELQTDDIAYISCEFSDYSDGDIDPGTIINAVLNNQASAIVLYSIFADNCLFNPKEAFQTSLIYSMQNASSSLATVDALQKSIPPNPPASIFANQSSSAGGASTG